MTSCTTIRSDHSRDKAHIDSIKNINACYPCLEQAIQNVIISEQLREDFSSEPPTCLGLGIVMTVPAIITAISFVCPSISYLLSAMKTFGQMSDYFLSISHLPVFSVKSGYKKHAFKYLSADFSFSLTMFFFFFKFQEG